MARSDQRGGVPIAAVGYSPLANDGAASIFQVPLNPVRIWLRSIAPIAARRDAQYCWFRRAGHFLYKRLTTSGMTLPKDDRIEKLEPCHDGMEMRAGYVSKFNGNRWIVELNGAEIGSHDTRAGSEAHVIKVARIAWQKGRIPSMATLYKADGTVFDQRLYGRSAAAMAILERSIAGLWLRAADKSCR